MKALGAHLRHSLIRGRNESGTRVDLPPPLHSLLPLETTQFNILLVMVLKAVSEKCQGAGYTTTSPVLNPLACSE